MIIIGLEFAQNEFMCEKESETHNIYCYQIGWDVICFEFLYEFQSHHRINWNIFSVVFG